MLERFNLRKQIYRLFLYSFHLVPTLIITIIIIIIIIIIVATVIIIIIIITIKR